MDLRKEKQIFLIEEIQSKGYDTTDFASFLEYKKRKDSPENLANGVDIDNWSIDELKNAVVDFKATYRDPAAD